MKFCVSSARSVGCTFLDWSIHFLSKQHYFYHVISKAWIPLSQNPLSKINAHGHKKNHPSGADLNLKFINSFNDTSKGDLFSVYPFKMHVDNMCNKLGYQLSDMQTPNILKKINQEIDLDYQKIFNDTIDTDFEKYIENPKLKFLDVQFGYLCNLSCLPCEISVKW